MGTVAYMSPEKATGGQVDERSDLYSLGGVLYELVTGRPPFPGDHPVAVISQHINNPPVMPTTINPHVPPRLELLILQLLAKDPDERPPSTLTEVDRKPLRALIIDNSDDDTAELIRALQEGGYEPTFERVDRALAMNNALETGEWDVVIADYSMPHFSAPAALKVMQMNELDLPFIIVSRQISEEIAVEAMRAGAHDYVMKDNLSRLVPAVERELLEAVVRRARRIKEDEEGQMKAQLEQRVTELTALNNLFQEHMRQRSDVIQAYRRARRGAAKAPTGPGDTGAGDRRPGQARPGTADSGPPGCRPTRAHGSPPHGWTQGGGPPHPEVAAALPPVQSRNLPPCVPTALRFSSFPQRTGLPPNHL